jgi:hypothetical protein
MARHKIYLAVASALILAGAASVALFVSLQELRPFIAVLKGQFYGAMPNAPNARDMLFERAFSPAGRFTLILAVWPSLVLFLLEGGATYVISKLLPFKGRFAVARCLITGAALSLLLTASIFVAMWPVYGRAISH